MGSSKPEINLLGPLQVLVDGETTAVPRAQVRSLICILAAQRGHELTPDVLIDHLWADTLPTDPRASLAVVLSRLRSNLGGARDALRTTDHGYLLEANVDIHHFDDALVAARQSDLPAQRVKLLSDALSLWRGEPFGGDEESSRLSAVTARLQEQRWNAITLMAEALSDTDDHEGVVRSALPHAQEQPHREQLVLCVARSLGLVGRKTDGLTLLTAARDYLREEFGLSPSPALDELEQSLLDNTIDLRSGASVPRATSELTFVGRELVVSQMLEATQPLVVIGEPGIGKTELVRQLESRLESVSRPVALVQASSAPERPMETLADLISTIASKVETVATRTQEASILFRIAPETFPDQVELHAITRDALVAGAVAWIVRNATEHDMTVIVDDAQWLDSATASVVQGVVAAGARIILASRPEPPGLVGALVSSVDRHVNLSPLSLADTTEALEAASPRLANATRAQALWQRSGGNPLFLTLLLRLVEEGDDIDGPLPTSVLVAVQQRIQALSERSQRTLQQAAVIGPSIDMSVLRQLSPTADSDVLEAAQNQIVISHPTEDTVEFAHALVREGLLQLLSHGQEVSLHDQVGLILELTGAAPATYARHYEAAASIEPLRAGRAHLAAAQDLADSYAWVEAHEHAERAQRFLGPDDELARARLAILQGRAQRDLHHGGEPTGLLDAVRLARLHGDNSLFVEAVVAWCIHGWTVDSGETVQPIDLIEEALRLQLNGSDRAILCAAGATLVLSDHHERGRELYHDGLNLAFASADPNTQARVLALAHWGLGHPEDLTMLIEATTLFKDIAGADRHIQWQVATTEFGVGVTTLNLDLIRSSLATMRSIAGEFAPSTKDWELAHTEAAFAHLQNDMARAHAHLDRSRQLGLASVAEHWVRPIHGICMVAFLRSQGRGAEAAPLVDKAIAANPSFRGWHSIAAATAAAAGDLDRVRSELDFVLAGNGLRHLRPTTFTTEVAILADGVAAVNDQDRAALLYEALAPFSGRITWSGVCTFGPVDATLATLASILGDAEAALRYRANANAATSLLQSLGD